MSVITEVLAKVLRSQADSYVKSYIEKEKAEKDAFYEGAWSMCTTLTDEFISAGVSGSGIAPIMAKVLNDYSTKLKKVDE